MFARKPSHAMLVTLCAFVSAATAIGAAGQTHLARLEADDPMSADMFGRSVAIDGDFIAVGVPSVNPTDVPGRVFVYQRTGPVWVEAAELFSPESQPDDAFGQSVAIDGSRLVVGSPFHSSANPPPNFHGAAYVFENVGGDWTFEAKLTNSDVALGDGFGIDVAIDGDRVVVGSWRADQPGIPFSGVAYIFRNTGDEWIEEAKLTACDAASGDGFGISVAIDAGRAVIGAYQFPLEGKARVYVLGDNGTPQDPSDDSWSEEAKLVASDGELGDEFGYSVDIDGDLVAIGARRTVELPGVTRQGAVYIFRHDGIAWEEEAAIRNDDFEGAARFGQSVSLVGERVLIGSPEFDYSTPGTAFLYAYDQTEWMLDRKIPAPDPTGNMEFSRWVALSPSLAVIGDRLFDLPGVENAGVAYVVCVDATICPPSLTPVGPRYFDVGPFDQTEPVALRVGSTDEACVDLYVQAPELIAGHSIARLAETPVFLTGDQWGSFALSDDEVVPTATYVIQAELEDATASEWASGKTWAWGDTNNSGLPVDFDDILCVLDAFAGVFPNGCSFLGADLEPAVPNGVIDFDDVLAVLDAFAGAGFLSNPTHIDPCP